jgi:hypothetical protein
MSLAKIVRWSGKSMSEFYTRDIALGVNLPHSKMFLKTKHEKYFEIIVICEMLFLKGLAKL